MFIPLPVRVPRFIKWLHPSWYVWDKPVKGEKILYLTFDDGPIPEVTEWVLDTLSRKRIKSTFFCIGDNICKHPTLFKRIIAEGHQVGNHTYNHLKGWETDTATYIENTQKANTTILETLGDAVSNKTLLPLFRPPYGKIKKKQAKALRALEYQIIMYRTVAYDWEAVSPEKCAQNIIKNARNGDIIVFHDSVKAEKNLKGSLETVIDYYLHKGYTFKTL